MNARWLVSSLLLAHGVLATGPASAQGEARDEASEPERPADAPDAATPASEAEAPPDEAEPSPDAAPNVVEAAPAAPDPARLEALVAEASERFERRAFAEAAERFTAAIAHTGDPAVIAALRFNVAACLERTPALDRAVEAWRTYASSPGATDAERADAEAAIAALLEGAATITITTSTPAEVFVGELSVGSAPGTIHLAPAAEVVLELRAPGHARAQRTLEIAAQAELSVDVTLVREDAALEEARARIARGEQLFAENAYDAALAEFEAAHALLRGGGDMYLALYNVALCHQRLGRIDLAVRYYEEYLSAAPAAEPGRAEVDATVRTLRDLLGTIVLETNVDGVEVWVDGRRLGVAPGEVRVAGGLHDVELRAAGAETARFELQIAAGQRIEREVELALLAEGGGLGPEGFVAAATFTGVGLLTWAALGSAFLALKAQIEGQGVDGTPASDYTLLEGLAISADVALGVTAAGALVSIVLAALTDWDGGRPARATRPVPGLAPTALLFPSVSPEGAGLAIGGTF